MAYVTPDKYSPYPRVCDVCGQLRSVNTMRKLDGQTYVCDKHTGERTAIMLDTLNAHARPPQTWPNKDAKPQNPLYPNSLEADESALFNFIDQQITNQARYERVTSGDGSPMGVDIVPTMAWAARYLYDLIVQNTRPQRFITRGKQLLKVAADYIYSRQRGFGTSPTASRATDPFWGGVLESGATTYVTDDVSASGLALLYAYRVLGTGSYLAGARGVASYLRNVQAIGSNGHNPTSSNAAGTARLYTGAVASEVSTISGIDTGEVFYSNHLFYPSGLLCLEFWDELEETDGDQTIGGTGPPDGFDSSPAQLLSTSIEDMRECWETGITDSTATLINGLSSTTPREFFNAYPASKLQFPSIGGTGLWEFQDGGASTGTMVTAQNYAIALGSLFAVEGVSTQVAAVSDWLRTFTSNEDFETPDDISTATLARSTTGDYDSTVCLSTLLMVRDPDDSYAAIAMNGSSLYDWGAFGALSRLWASRYATSFKNARINALNIARRFDDGKPSDGLYFDRIELRGLSGLTHQTAFASDGLTSYAPGTTRVTAPSTVGMVLWLKGDAGLSPASGALTTWLDQAGQHQDVTGPGVQPLTGVDTINGIPAVTFPTTDGFYYASHTGALKDRNGVAMTYANARSVFAVIKPVLGASTVVGGPVFAMADSPNFECLFDVESWFTHSQAWFVFDNMWKLSGYQLLAQDVSITAWNGVTVVSEWRSSGYPNIAFAVNGGNDQPLTDQAGTPTTNQLGGTGVPPAAGFAVGNCWTAGGGIQEHNFHGAIGEIIVYDHNITGAPRTQTVNYLTGRFTASPTIDMTNDAVRAAQYGRSFREAH